ncbi:uncharacterized protein LOC143430974 [Xylocopa sonorina]|uniref:uncharacterized protein LOC143430974 n=1 Tax=Xylocopa sonorina TaxID=1818115 RepID=UPI00403AE890
MVSTVVTENLSTEPEEVAAKTTLTLKDGLNNRPPTLFRHASMQKIRHCCQNLNLFPYLLYSFDNSKSHLIARKMHLYVDQFLQGIAARLFFICKSLRLSLTRETLQPRPTVTVKSPFRTSSPKRRQNRSLFLIMAVYFAPLLLMLQLIGLFSVVVLGKYTPGFIFLISVLLFLGCISLKILFHESETSRCERTKSH